jgi:hypothetical protein
MKKAAKADEDANAQEEVEDKTYFFPVSLSEEPKHTKMKRLLTDFIHDKSLVFRHLIVKSIAPKLYATAETYPRPMIKFLKKNFHYPLTGVEIGVAYGNNSKDILKELPISKLYLVDLYGPYLEKYSDGYYANSTHMFAVAQKNLIRYNKKIQFIRKRSEDAIEDVPDALDFVYIDGNHYYDFVKRDIQLYYAKTRVGGIVGGHDFYGKYPDVAKAVIEFAESNDLEIHADHGKIDWWLIKQ